MADSPTTGDTAPGPSMLELPGWIAAFLDDTFAHANDLVDEYRPVAHLAAVPDVFLFSTPDAAKHVLQDNHRNYKKAKSYELLKPLVGEGLLTSDGDLWLRQRRIVAPMFHQQRVESFVQQIENCVRDMLELWDQREPGDTVDAVEQMSKLTLSVIGRILIDRDIGRESEWMLDGLDLVLKDINRRFTSPLALPRSIPTPHNRRVQSVLDRLDALVYDLIDERRGEEEAHDDLLSMLMLAEDEETGERMSDEQVRDEMMTFIVAGHETTANALAWTLYLLAQHPDQRRRLEREVDDVVSGDVPTLEELGDLTFTEQVIDESYRLYPPAWSVGRTPIEDDVVAGYEVPAGSIVSVGPYFVHHNPDVWDDPETFDPDRFGPDADPPDHRFAHFPFGGGPRKCVGAELGFHETKIALAAIARNFRLELVDEPPVEPEATVTITPRGGLEMALQPRD